jgi:hypothetical protein
VQYNTKYAFIGFTHETTKPIASVKAYQPSDKVNFLNPWSLRYLNRRLAPAQKQVMLVAVRAESKMWRPGAAPEDQ